MRPSNPRCTSISLPPAQDVPPAGQTGAPPDGQAGSSWRLCSFGQGLSKTLWALAVLVAAVLAVFARTVLMGEPISEICRVAEWDSLFAAYRTGFGTPCDPSIVQLLVPGYYLVANLWHSGQIPLWNPFSGFGCPLLGDLQTTVFSPVRLLFDLSRSMYIYNLQLVLQVVLAAVGGFFLTRTVGLSRSASVFAGLSYALCPFNLYYLELLSGVSHCLFPLSLWLFARAALRPDWTRTTLAGGGCALLIISGHPESSFFGIVFGSALFFLLLSVSARASAVTRLKQGIAALSWAAIVAFCLAAPVLIPFAEFLGNSDCYKFSNGVAAYVPWQALAYNLIQPGFRGASPYLGVVAFLVIPLAVIAARREPRVRCVLVTGLAAGVLTALPGLAGSLFVVRPLCYLITVYCLPIFLLMLAVAAGYGFEQAFERGVLRERQALIAFACAAGAILLLPPLFYVLKVPLHGGDFDMILPHMAVSMSAWARDLGIIAALFAALFVVYRVKPSWRPVLPAICLALSFVSEVSVARASLPPQGRFDFQAAAPLNWLARTGERVVSVGSHLLRPNTNAVYGVNLVASHNPMFPSGFLTFLRTAGAQIDQFSQTFSNRLSPLLNLASVKYALSQVPVAGQDESPLAACQPRTVNLRIAPGFIIDTTALVYDRLNHEVWGAITWRGQPKHVERYQVMFIVLDASARLIWFSEPESLVANPAADGGRCKVADTEFAVPVSLTLPAGSRFSVGVQVVERDSFKLVIPQSGADNGVTVLGSFQVAPASEVLGRADKASRRFRLVSETAGKIRVYENLQALPRVYVVHNARAATSRDEALRAISSVDFKATDEVVLEGTGASMSRAAGGPTDDTRAPDGTPDRVTVRHKDANSVLVEVDAAAPGYLVVTDAYYPGWQARVNGKAMAILRANYMFRAVPVPAGRSLVEWRYEPASFKIGLALFAGCLVVIMLSALRVGWQGGGKRR